MLKFTSFWTLLFLFFCLSLTAIAGETGKLAGKVTDAQTGESLPGTNIIIEGTTLGAAADINGNFTILNIPPGIYQVRFSFVGYRTLVVTNVRVNVDFTTRLDKKLSLATLELGTVEVVGERYPLVRADLTNTQVAITSDVIDALPVDQIRDVIRLQAGIIQDNSGNIHIRGGRSNEIAYQINGVSLNNPFFNSQNVGLATNAVQEVSISIGTFSAEYGNALSGVINYVTKEGGPKLGGTFRFWTGDNFSGRDDIFFNIDEINIFNNRRYEGTLGGPVPFLGKNVNFFISGVRVVNKGYLYGIRVYNPDEILLIAGQSFIIDPFGNGKADGNREIVAMNTGENLNFSGKLTWKPDPNVKLSYDLILDDGENLSFSRTYRFNPDGRATRFDNGTNHSVGMTHTLSSKMFYTLKVGLGLRYTRTWAFEDPFDPGYVASFGSLVSNNLISPTAYLAGGTNLSRSWRRTRSWNAKLDVVSQVHPVHELKFGGELRNHRMETEVYTLLYDVGQAQPIIPDPKVNPDFTQYQAYTRKPLQAAVYILDKMELARSFILNIGARYEFLDTKAPYNPDLVGAVDTGVEKNLVQSTPKHRFSPRISLSFPITDRGIIRFSYGHFYQNPDFASIYTNPRFEDFEFIQVPTFGDPNLEPERSIQYEMGLQQQFTDDMKIDLTIYYKDVNNLIQSRRVFAGEVAATKEYNVVTNISYAYVKGITASLLKRRSPGGLFSASLDYTFQVAEGAFDDPLKLAVDSRSGRDTEQEFILLSHDRTHTLNGTMSLRKKDSWIISAIGSVWLGTPYTPSLPSSVQTVQFEQNSDRRPTNINIDLRLEKFVKIAGAKMSLFLQIENALDLKNERFVYGSTGNSLNSLAESTNPNLFNDLRRTIENDVMTGGQNFFPLEFLDNYYKREDWLSKPREIRLGLTYSF